MASVFSARPVSVRRGDRSYNASFREVDGLVYVDSAYGPNARGAPVGKMDSKVIAEQLLGELVARSGR